MDFMDFDLHYPEPKENQRSAYRARIPGLKAVVKEKGVYEVKDLSATGLAFSATGGDMSQGEIFQLALAYGDKTLIDMLHAKVVRAGTDGLTACLFMGLDLRQEAKLDKLVLEVQKRLISLRKAKEEK